MKKPEQSILMNKSRDNFLSENPKSISNESMLKERYFTVIHGVVGSFV